MSSRYDYNKKWLCAGIEKAWEIKENIILKIQEIIFSLLSYFLMFNMKHVYRSILDESPERGRRVQV